MAMVSFMSRESETRLRLGGILFLFYPFFNEHGTRSKNNFQFMRRPWGVGVVE